MVCVLVCCEVSPWVERRSKSNRSPTPKTARCVALTPRLVVAHPLTIRARRSTTCRSLFPLWRGQVTFNKRSQGLFKKAIELSILCCSDVLVCVWNGDRLYQYASRPERTPTIPKKKAGPGPAGAATDIKSTRSKSQNGPPIGGVSASGLGAELETDNDLQALCRRALAATRAHRVWLNEDVRALHRSRSLVLLPPPKHSSLIK